MLNNTPQRTADARKLSPGDLQRILANAAQALRQTCDRAPERSETPPAAELLLDSYSYLRSEIRELQQAFSPGFCRQLARRGQELRIYWIAADALAQIEGPLTAPSLVRFFAPEQLREQLNVTPSLAELWAIAPIVKLLLIEELQAAISKQPFESEECSQAVEAAIVRLRSVDRILWNPLIEAISVVDAILRRDPASVYAQMEFESRDAYRHVVEEIARSSKRPEEEVAQMAISLAMAASSRDDRGRASHAGYYLTGEGLAELLSAGRFRLPFAQALRHRLLRAPGVIYIGSILAVTALLTAAFYLAISPAPLWLIALLPLPLSQVAVSLVNLAMNLIFKPRRLPRLDFSKGIPGDCRTFIVIPTLLLSRAGVERLVERLEIHYLANRDRNLLFALLTDFPDSSSASAGNDDLLEYCATKIERLNRAHASGGISPFYLFHRPRAWNECESVWMGRERKRGKLEDFNSYLLGSGNAFSAIVGEAPDAQAIRFVITLDSDTQLPRDTAWKMIGTMAHPLNQARVDSNGLVRAGYAILQPRVSVSMESSGKSRLARVYSGQTGLDPYSRAISDVYQDLFGRATFTGKGLYDLRAFHQAMHGRFPDNSILSHDLIEGEHAGVALVTDIDVIDDYPATYEAYSKRKHRWIRGDWQILPWLFPRIPSGSGTYVRNVLSFLSRWKIADNLRRSLFECSLAVLLITVWVFSPSAAEKITLAAVVMLLLPAYADVAISLLRLPPVRFWRSYFRERGSQLLRAHVEALLTLIFLLHQALLSADAIARTLIRRFITHRNLLEWESMAQSESRPSSAHDLITTHMFACSLSAITLLAILLVLEPPSFTAILVAILWLISPLAAALVNGHPFSIRRENPNDVEFLRGIALRTWSFFRDFSTADHHWLVPDNMQQQPYAVARRTSPTNLGLQLDANLAAFDFGYLTAGELAKRGQDLLNTMVKLERHNGHFFNWYDTGTLAPLPPRYVSTVDSGNLAASLIVFRQGCEEIVQGPPIDCAVLDGLRDHCVRLRRALPASLRSLSIMRIVSSLIRQLESRPPDLFFWEGVLSEAAATIRRLDQHIDWACDHLEARNSDAVIEIRYLQAALQERIASALDGLCALAPWLSAPFEPFLRSCANDPQFHNLIGALAAIPSIGGLPRAYDSIRAEIAALPKNELRESLTGLLTRLSGAVEAAREPAGAVITALLRNSRLAAGLTHDMDFHFLLDKKSGLLRIGYNSATAGLDESSYDLLASEARTAVFLAIAKGDAPREAWFRLGRKITTYRGWSTLVSWSGTMFEYLMPALFMKTFEPTLLTESLRGAVKIQQLYARQLGVPWGISEAAHSERDGSQFYRYRAFGVPMVSLKANAVEDVVISPYSTLLALAIDPEEATENLREMASRGWMGRYGFFESVDFRRTRFTAHNRAVVVRSFMAHHQAMSLLSLANALRDNSMRRRFHAEPMVAATELLLQERVPALLAVDQDAERHEDVLDVMKLQFLGLAGEPDVESTSIGF